MTAAAQRREIIYQPSPTIERFLQSTARIKAIKGPVGSGKSTGAVMDLAQKIEAQPNSKWLCIRNTYRELEDTALATFNDWVGHDFGTFKQRTMTWTCYNGAEVLFRALDKVQDIGKLKSLEVTGAWLNEASEIPKAVFDLVQTRVGRYPPKRLGGALWSGVILDTNPPDDFHWFYRSFEEDLPEGWEIYHQPSGLSPQAENVENLPADYYTNIAKGKDAAWIAVFCEGQYGYIQDGRPVYPMWQDLLHAKRCEYEPGLGLIVGLDFGLTPAAIFMQQSVSGQFRVIEELVTEDMAAVQFSDLLGERLRSKYRDERIEVFGDPAGTQRSQVDARTPFQILKKAGIDARAASTNDPLLRTEAVARNLTRLTMTGEPGLIIDPSCRYTRRGMAGGYKYKLQQVVGEEIYHLYPTKNQYSHPCEALQYAMVGAGQARKVVGTRNRKPLDYSNFNPTRVN